MQCCILAFLQLTETKLKNWTKKFGFEDSLSHTMSQYKSFVSKNKIFQEFNKAMQEFNEVCTEWRRETSFGKKAANLKH